MDAMDKAMLAVVVACLALLYFYFHAEALHILHVAWHHWRPVQKLVARLTPSGPTAAAVDVGIAVLGGLAVVAVVHLRQPSREKAKSRRAERLAAIAAGKKPALPEASAVKHVVPEAHFGPAQSGAAGVHALHDPRRDAANRLGAGDLETYDRDGYVVVRGLLRPAELERLKAEMNRIVDAWPADGEAAPGDAPETPLVAFDPAVVTGQLKVKTRADGVRRLFRMAVHDAFFARFAKDPRFVDFLARLWGPNVALLQSMALMKPPKTGEKRFHQDQAYFRLAPSRVAAYWIAVDDTDAENGCMHVVPGSHKAGVAPHGAQVGLDPSDPEYRRLNLGGVYYSALEPPAARDVVAVPMRAGDAVLFHGDLVHGTPPNASQSRRRFAVQLHYADANCRPTACEDGVPAPNATYGPGGGFDCAPEAGGACVEPQYWFYRQAELIVAGKRVPGCI